MLPNKHNMTRSIQKICTVAIIGSFRQHYTPVCEAWAVFKKAGLDVTSPKGTPILQEGIPFVRFASDPPQWDDPFVQTVALHRILRADFVFVVAPAGYVGRTTCYEVGRIVQARRPLYFSEHPKDLPVRIPDAHIQPAIRIAEQIQAARFTPIPMYSNGQASGFSLEHDLLIGRYKEDDEITS